MPPDRGWIKLHRRLLDADVWRETPFSPGAAWVDLLLLAEHRDREVEVDGVPVPLRRGQLVTSLRQLGARWGWSYERVRRFLAQLEARRDVKRDCLRDSKSDPGGTVLTVCKYDRYQGTDNNSPSERDSSRDSSRATESLQREERLANDETKRDSSRDASRDTPRGESVTAAVAKSCSASLFGPPKKDEEASTNVEARSLRSRPSPKKKTTDRDPRVTTLRERFAAAYLARFGRACVETAYAKTGKLAKAVLAALDAQGVDALAEVEALFPAYFDLAERDSFHAGAPLERFLTGATLNRLRASRANGNGAPAVAVNPRRAAVDAALRALVPDGARVRFDGEVWRAGWREEGLLGSTRASGTNITTDIAARLNGATEAEIPAAVRKLVEVMS